MADICRETALRMYKACKAEPPEADPDETVQLMAEAVHEAMFQANYCSRRCDSEACRQNS